MRAGKNMKIVQNPEKFIEIPVELLGAAVRTAYDLSSPMGLGFLHYKSGPLDDETVREIMTVNHINYSNDVAVHMDYVHGRCCKFWVYKNDEGRLFINPNWPDHSDYDLQDLLAKIGLDAPRKMIDAARRARAAE
jgi:hypothetical protein